MIEFSIGVIPVQTFATCVFVSALGELDRGAEPSRTLLMRSARVTLDALIAGLIAYAVMTHPIFSGYGLRVFGITVIAATITFFMPLFRKTLPRVWNAALDVGLNFLARLLNTKFNVKE